MSVLDPRQTSAPPVFDPDSVRDTFARFYHNPAINVLAPIKRWTVSGSLATDLDDPEDPKATRKAPIDMRELLDNGRLRGAWQPDHSGLVSLDELTNRLPMAANTAFRLSAGIHGFVIIDIEPNCPPEIAADLCALPEILYAEASMSGDGHHLLMPLPDNFGDYPIAAGKKRLQEEHKWYEVLIEHFVTFTRMPPKRPAPQPPGEITSLSQVWAQLAETARQTTIAAAEVATTIEPPDISGAEFIINEIVEAATGRMKSPTDFNHDTSRYEFSVLGTLYHQMLRCLAQRMNFGEHFSTGDQAWLLYRAASTVLTPRAKHKERRNNRPFLLDRAAAMVASQQHRSR